MSQAACRMVPADRSLCSDLVVGATAVTIWMVRESRRLDMRGLGWVLLSRVTITFAIGAPLVLHRRERQRLEPSRLGQESALING